MNPRLFRFILALGLAATAFGLAVFLTSPIALSYPIESAASTGNLLFNPDFEDGYYFYPGHNSIRVPNGWGFVWYTDTPPFGDWHPFMQPEVSVVNCAWPYCNAVNYPPRINTGQHAVESGKRWASQDVALYQAVGNVPIGARVTADAWMAAWVSNCDPNIPPYPLALSLLDNNAADCAPGLWPLDSNHMMVGIDPYAATVVWNWDAANPPWWGPYDYYSSTVPVVTVAYAHTVTMFLRGVTVQPAKFNTVYFDTASLTYDFPITWQIDQEAEWPLTTAITIGLQVPVSLTQVSAVLQDPIGQLTPIESLSSTTWRFTPHSGGTYTLTVMAHEFVEPQVQTIEVQTLPFSYQQDQLLTDTTLITYALSSPIMLTDLRAQVNDAQNQALSTTWVLSDFTAGRYLAVGTFDAKSSGWHTVTLAATEFTQPFVQRVLVIAARVHLPVVLR
jgi:hypothetical protein